MQQQSMACKSTEEFAAKKDKLFELIQILCDEIQLEESASDLIGTS